VAASADREHSGLHQCIATMASEPGPSTWCGVAFTCLLPLVSLGALVAQIVVSLVIVVQGASPACEPTMQSGCSRGQFCSNNPDFAIAQCEDCSQLLPQTTTMWPSLQSFCEWAVAAYGPQSPADLYHLTFTEPARRNASFVGSCAMWLHCMNEDLMPTRCDYLVYALQRVKLTQVALMATCAVLFATQLMSDLDQADTTLACLAHRTRQLESARRRVPLRIYHSLLYAMHKISVPCLVSAATAVLLLTSQGVGSLSALNIILNFLAVGFLFELDDLVSYAIMPEHLKEAARAAVVALSDPEAESVNRDTYASRPVRWLPNRIFAFTIATLLVVQVIYFEDVMQLLSGMMQSHVAIALGLKRESRKQDQMMGGSGNPQIVACEDIAFTTLGAAWLDSAGAAVFFAAVTPPKKFPEHWMRGAKSWVRVAFHVLSAALDVLLLFSLYLVQIWLTTQLRRLPYLNPL